MTSIEWLFEKLWDEPKDKLTWHSILNKAKEMHKQEMIHFANDFWNWAKGGDFDISDAEQYYQETFVSKGSGEVELPQQEISDEKTLSEKYQEYKDWLNEIPEISDEEIEKAANYFYPLLGEQSKKALWINGCRWYREQLKTKIN